MISKFLQIFLVAASCFSCHICSCVASVPVVDPLESLRTRLLNLPPVPIPHVRDLRTFIHVDILESDNPSEAEIVPISPKWSWEFHTQLADWTLPSVGHALFSGLRECPESVRNEITFYKRKLKFRVQIGGNTLTPLQGIGGYQTLDAAEILTRCVAFVDETEHTHTIIW